ncbi:MAG TPA: hypothetical protein VNN20_16075 [Thermodesulfobacteriota bacterium]|nr:hypothetical protein [Thermodesulfobacteriota bacterium]
MKGYKVLQISCLVLVLLLSLGSKAFSEETIQQAVEREMPLLRGDMWIKMDPDSKVAFIWGAGHVVTIEEVIMQKYPELKRDSFVMKVVEASTNSPMKMNDIVTVVDTYYQANPDKLDTPVMRVIWDAVIKPNIKTGIAGKPIN